MNIAVSAILNKFLVREGYKKLKELGQHPIFFISPNLLILHYKTALTS